MSSARILCFLVVLLPASAAMAQVRIKPSRPLQPSTPVKAEVEEKQEKASRPPAPESRISTKEALRLKAIYDALPEEEQAEMRAHYEAMDIDLLSVFAEKAGAETGEAAPKRSLLPLITRKKFARTPQSVLAARTKLGLEVTVRPTEDEDPAKVAEWLHLQVMAGEWDELRWFLAERAGTDAEGIYSHVIQSHQLG